MKHDPIGLDADIDPGGQPQLQVEPRYRNRPE
jgi:hypothetical protein